MTTSRISPSDIRAARERIAGKVERTPTVTSRSLSQHLGEPVYLKLEHRQTTGAFKLRGASNAIASLTEEEKARGVVAASTGNHGRALAYAAQLQGIHATICMSRLVPQNKLDEIRRLGAEIRIVGNSQDDAQQEVERLVAKDGLIMLPPFDHPAIVAGQGTLGLEIIEQVPDAALVLVPLSGGGLAAGVAAAVKGVSPATKVMGVSMARGAAMKASLDAGHPVLVEELPTLADSLGGGIGLDNRLTFSMCRDLLDDVILLSEGEIATGIRHAYEQEREIVEGAGAVGIAAVLAGKVRVSGPTVLILSGRNIDMALHRKIICGEAIAESAA
ncbi:hydroxyectoine utilization dehydratase EutB [Mesorhizobium sp. LMG 17147]|uniref:hydroxyectoine utilization dehydratase EutB n=1 Tax=Mesorhizobium sp. LMG 17147 TaxID=2963091 RepID=UPI0020C99F32|nr:hydroxyectoine utilization dehydratase EutB [Mesorhizobium sp. LMG 17147]MCP9232700.1 hydroxyectoine utilization dehydratase EutB [Mesorhizobium sp. LMG 17147]